MHSVRLNERIQYKNSAEMLLDYRSTDTGCHTRPDSELVVSGFRLVSNVTNCINYANNSHTTSWLPVNGILTVVINLNKWSEFFLLRCEVIDIWAHFYWCPIFWLGIPYHMLPRPTCQHEKTNNDTAHIFSKFVTEATSIHEYSLFIFVIKPGQLFSKWKTNNGRLIDWVGV